MDEQPQICFRDGAAGRRPVLIGTRLDVWQVVETLRANRNSVPKTATYLSVAESKVRAIVRYYAQYQDEVDAFAERMHALAEQEEAAFRRDMP